MCNSILATTLTIFISSPPPTHPVPTPNLRVKACHSYWDLYAVLRSHPSPTEPVVHTASRVPEEVLRLLDPHVRSPTHESSVIHLCSVCSMYNSVVLSVCCSYTRAILLYVHLSAHSSTVLHRHPCTLHVLCPMLVYMPFQISGPSFFSSLF